jgi:hypothetical protein
MRDEEWRAIFGELLVDAQKELANYKAAIANHGLRVYHRDVNGERDVTERELQSLQATIEEYQAALRDD